MNRVLGLLAGGVSDDDCVVSSNAFDRVGSTIKAIVDDVKREEINSLRFNDSASPFLWESSELVIFMI